jgi:hypothetical protein
MQGIWEAAVDGVMFAAIFKKLPLLQTAHLAVQPGC